jgi:outer membrane protein OmpA-like peptidoglycan-associated protein
MPLNVAAGALLVFTLCIPVTPALAQMPAEVRVVNGTAPIHRWFHAQDILLHVEAGTTLKVLDKEEVWFWVILPPDIHGTRKVGWIHAVNVEPVIVRAEAPKPGQGDGRAPVPADSPAAGAAPPATIAEDKVSITPRRDERTSTSASASAGPKTFTFEDVHFDRDRDSLRPEDLPVLRATVTALQADPSLVVDIEGYTCNLGTTAHNLALGARRADAVKRYLVSQGIAADRLNTVSFGEERPRHDNSREETRQLNRRVAVAPRGGSD